ncbi:methyltransferase family protein [Amycolatopsis sulphurea]|uniref:Methyltransferase family protein n=2 Tax=Amycolatopsis sulphurea TaxID=76022 RepID=A0A2A9FZS3_9PSEU|nr:methyltransferase family protein [Amycolatopsis sulphurea]
MMIMNMIDVAAVARAMATGVANPGIQLVQTRFRAGLVESWDIQPGDRVLEIGCGQGDMTAVLAAAVGEHGQVTGVDIADPSYGAPITLAESAEFLRATPFGDRIDIRFGFDVLTETFPDDEFDHVVLSQCSWYFASLDQLRATLARVRPWARRLAFAEWDLRPTSHGQLAHLLAVQIQGMIEAAGERGDGNVRTPFSYQRLLAVLEETGWQASGARTIDTTGMHDAAWEITICQDVVKGRLHTVPAAMRDLIQSHVDVLETVTPSNEALPVYSVTAAR